MKTNKKVLEPFIIWSVSIAIIAVVTKTIGGSYESFIGSIIVMVFFKIIILEYNLYDK